MSASPTAALEPAWNRMKALLFPVDVDAWLALGLSAWLASFFGQTGFNLTIPGNPFGADSNGSAPPPTATVDEALELVTEYAPLVAVGLGAAAMLVLLLCWLGSHGHYVFIDCIVRGRAEVREPWRRTSAHANGLFWAQIALFAVVLLASTPFIGSILLQLIPVWKDGRLWDVLSGGLGGFDVGLLTVLGRPFLGLMLVGLAYALANILLLEIVVPIAYARGGSLFDAMGVFTSTVLPGNAGVLALFVLVRIALSVGAWMFVVAVVLASCCMALVPYVGTVLTLPAWIFLRAYSLYFVSQFGPDLAVLAPGAATTPAVGPASGS